MINFRSEYQVRERRKYPRVPATFGVRMIDVQLNRMESFPNDTPCYETRFLVTDAVGTNVSEGGFAFESETEPSPSSIFGLEFSIRKGDEDGDFPCCSATSGGETRFRAVGQVVWTAVMETRCLVGMRFIDQNAPRTTALRRLVAEHESQDSADRFLRGGTRDFLAGS